MGEGCNVPFEEEWEVGYATGSFTIQNRYVTESVPVGCHVYHELGKKFGVPTPVIDSMIVLGGVMNKTDYMATGLTLEELGIAHLDKDQLLLLSARGRVCREHNLYYLRSTETICGWRCRGQLLFGIMPAFCIIQCIHNECSETAGPNRELTRLRV